MHYLMYKRNVVYAYGRSFNRGIYENFQCQLLCLLILTRHSSYSNRYPPNIPLGVILHCFRKYNHKR